MNKPSHYSLDNRIPLVRLITKLLKLIPDVFKCDSYRGKLSLDSLKYVICSYICP
jgi:hypothetical protein